MATRERKRPEFVTPVADALGSPGTILMGIRVLVVEDDAEIADYLVRGLREEGFAVTHAAHGDDAWHEMRGPPWDVVLLDWWLPGPDGLTLLQRFRTAGGTVPVLFLTARDA